MVRARQSAENPYESPREAASSPPKSLERIRRENGTLATIGCVVLLAIVGVFVMMGAVASLRISL
jgi:hypothetical protein